MNDKKAYLILENGTVFEGKSFGFEKETTGEIVFTTSMVGYLETLTDPSFFGQIVVQTFPLIGNYGVIPEDFESSKMHLNGYIVREWCHNPSNFRSEGNIDTFLKENKVPGLYGIDTRHLTKIVREYGVMNGKITYSLDNVEDEIKKLKDYKIVNAVKSVTTDRITIDKAEKEDFRVVLWNFGAKANIKRSLLKTNCTVIDVPSYTTAAEIAAYNPDGVMLTNGPGDPAENVEIIKQLKELFKFNIPIFGICLGHQLLALAHGAKTAKLKYGHRGGNQPVLDIAEDRVYITSQNHGYYVVSESIPNLAEMSFQNVNDKTCEGITYKDKLAFSVQFHPEASAGPLDTGLLFGRFVDLMREGKNNASK